MVGRLLKVGGSQFCLAKCRTEELVEWPTAISSCVFGNLYDMILGTGEIYSQTTGIHVDAYNTRLKVQRLRWPDKFVFGIRDDNLKESLLRETDTH